MRPRTASRDLGFPSEILYFCTTGWAPSPRRRKSSPRCHLCLHLRGYDLPLPPGAHWDLARPDVGPGTPGQSRLRVVQVWRCPAVSPRPLRPLPQVPPLHGRCAPPAAQSHHLLWSPCLSHGFTSCPTYLRFAVILTRGAKVPESPQGGHKAQTRTCPAQDGGGGTGGR